MFFFFFLNLFLGEHLFILWKKTAHFPCLKQTNYLIVVFNVFHSTDISLQWLQRVSFCTSNDREMLFCFFLLIQLPDNKGFIQ